MVFLIDDFDFSGIAGIGTLFDVEQVEVLRGPQATEFGAGAMAGVIKVKTQDADEDQTSLVRAMAAGQGTWSLGVAHGGALSDKVFYRVSANQYKSDGFIENTYLQRDDTDNLDEFTGRAKLRIELSDDAQLDLNYQYFNIDNGYDAFSLDNDGKTRSDEPGFDRQKTKAFGFKYQQTLSFADLVVIANQSNSELAYGYDEDWTFVGFHPWEYSSTDHYFRDRDTASFDVRLLSNDDSRLFNGKTDWVLGAYAKSSKEQLLRQYTYADSDFMSTYEPETKAVYLNTQTDLGDNVTLSFGLRSDRYDIDYIDSRGFTESTSDTMVGGKLVLDYSMSTATVYTSISRGYKAGGFNPDEQVSDEKRIFDPEYNWNYEVGVKGRFKDNKGYLRLAAFYMEREDTQISDFDVQEREDGSSSFIDVIDNADNGRNYGLEVEAAWNVTDDFTLTSNLGWLEATFSGYEKADGSFVEEQDQAQAPAYTFHVNADWQITEDIGLRIDVEGKDEFRFSDGHDELSPSYVLVNANLSYALEDWSVSLWANNLFDREYYVRGFGGFSNDPRDFYAEPEPYFPDW